MKRFLTFSVMFVLAFTLLYGCAEKPTQDIDAAKAAVDSVTAAGAEKYAPEALASVQRDYENAMAEVQAQEKKFIKNFDKAKELLATAKTNAQNAKQTAETKKAEAKAAAQSAIDGAALAAEEATSLLAGAPKGKGTTEDIEALKADLRGIEDSINEARALVDSGDYLEAQTKANAAKEQAVQIADQVKQAIEKTKKAKGKKVKK